MSESFWAAVVAAVASVLVPVVVSISSRDGRDEIQKEISILKQLQPGTATYEGWEKRVRFAVLDFANNESVKQKFEIAYRRYLILVVCGFAVYFLYPEGQAHGWNFWRVAGLSVLAGVILFTLLSALYFLLLALWHEANLLYMELEIRRFREKNDQQHAILEKLRRDIDKTERESSEIIDLVKKAQKEAESFDAKLDERMKKYDIPETEEGRDAQLYNQLTHWALRGVKREKVLSYYSEKPDLDEGSRGKMIALTNEVFDDFEEWRGDRDLPKFRKES